MDEPPKDTGVISPSRFQCLLNNEKYVEEGEITTSQEEHHELDISGVSQNKRPQRAGTRGRGRPKGAVSQIITRQA